MRTHVIRIKSRIRVTNLFFCLIREDLKAIVMIEARRKVGLLKIKIPPKLRRVLTQRLNNQSAELMRELVISLVQVVNEWSKAGHRVLLRPSIRPDKQTFMNRLRSVIVRTDRVLLKAVLEILNDLSMATIGRRWQGVASKIRCVRYVCGFLNIHRRIKKLTNLSKRLLLKGVVQPGCIFKHQKPAFQKRVPQVFHELIAISIKVEPIDRWNFVYCLRLHRGACFYYLSRIRSNYGA